MGDTRLLLFSTAACHLCEQALELLQPFLQQGAQQGVLQGDQQHRRLSWSLSEVDISEADDLFQRYGLIIPVLHHAASGNELHWPFDADSVQRFLEANAQAGE